MILTNPRERTRFFRFAAVGILGAGVDFGTFNLLVTFAQLPAVAASVCSFTLAVISNFVFNRFWTYPDSRSKRVHQQVVQFGIVSFIGLLIRTPVFAGMQALLIAVFSKLHLPGSLSPTFLGHNIGLGIAIIVVMFWNFFANRFWTYADVD